MQNRNLLLLPILIVACGGGDKPTQTANNGDCPAGMVKQGGDCVAPEGESGPGKTGTAGTSTSTSGVASANTNANVGGSGGGSGTLAP